MEYRRCSEVSDDLIFETFMEGFSDYIIQIPMTKEQFFARFFGPEGNSKDYSFIAFDEKKGAGLILGGIDRFDNLKTLRCGTMCIVPSERGTDVARNLFEKHMKTAKENNCKQLFLEVISTNYRAIKFYERQGYEKVYDLSYYSLESEIIRNSTKTSDISIEKISLDELKLFRDSYFPFHINWQNEINYMKKTTASILGIKENDELIGAMASTNGAIHFIGIKPEYQNKKLGSSLIAKLAEDKSIPKIKVSFPNNSSLKGFFEKIAFNRESISQYEMYKTL